MPHLPGHTDSYPWVPDPHWPPLQPYWSGLAAGRLRFPRCTRCKNYQWYPEPTCDTCGNGNFEWIAVPPRAQIYSFTILRRSFLPDFKIPTFIILAEIEGIPNVRLLTNAIDCDECDLRIGARVELVRKRVADSVYLPFARPMRSEIAPGTTDGLEVVCVDRPPVA